MPDESKSNGAGSRSETGLPVEDGAKAPAGELSPEEQMEQYEEDLKETDWGHQPC